MKKFFIVLGIMAIVGGAFFYMNSRMLQTGLSAPATYKVTEVQLGDQTIQAQIADTDALQQLGLSGRMGLREGTGMLFVFDTPGNYGFWMKDMNFPIDMIWANKSGVVSVEHSVSPTTFPQVFYPKNEAQYVIEVPAGFDLAHNIHSGSSFSIGQ